MVFSKAGHSSRALFCFLKGCHSPALPTTANSSSVSQGYSIIWINFEAGKED